MEEWAGHPRLGPVSPHSATDEQPLWETLMANRSERAQIAAQTVTITQTGQYTTPSGRTVSIKEAVQRSIGSSVLVRPGDALLVKRADEKLSGCDHETRFEVCNETTFAAGRRLAGLSRVAVLNFASAKNPGGGFLSGSQAQEESLARASALHACLERHMDYYLANRSSGSLLYTDHLIVSPDVPVFRNDDDQLLEEPWNVTILTSPAPNAGAIAKNDPASRQQIEPTFRRRIDQVLSAAIAFDHTAIVLGAWGCGVFGNDPQVVARLFGDSLRRGRFQRAFQHVAFAVLDRRGDTLAPFAAEFDS